MRRAIQGTVAALVVLGGASGARAAALSLGKKYQKAGDEAKLLRWNTLPVTYRLDAECSQDVPDKAACLNALRASITPWLGHPCSSLAVVEGPTFTGSPVYGNLANEIAFVEDGSWPLGQYTLGYAATKFAPDGSIVEVDVTLNGDDHQWSIDGSLMPHDVPSVATHEVGHAFGLQHPLGGFDLAAPPTMAPIVDETGQTASPEADDLAGLCFLYPKTPFGCATDAECPYVLADDAAGEEYYEGHFLCQAGACTGFTSTIPAGAGQIGDPCSGPYDCQTGLLCHPDGIDSQCTTACTSAASCPAGFGCMDLDAGKICLPGAPLGTPCKVNSDCVSDSCIAGFDGELACSGPCTDDPDCPPGWGCYQLQSGKLACAKDGAAFFGEPCDANGACQSGWCADFGGGGQCTQACPDGLCPCGGACGSAGSFGMVCFPGQPAVKCLPNGALCEAAAQCLGDLCLDGVCQSGCKSVGACTVCDGWPGAGDPDSDEVPDVCDNCPALSNAGQQDQDADGVGDACDGDTCPTGAPCQDGDPCTVGDSCAGGACVPGPQDLCGDGDPCTVDACLAGACQHTGLPCNDGDLCTTDACAAGACSFGVLVCDDGDACTTDSCAPAIGCLHAALACDDKNACTTDTCEGGSCAYAPSALACDDADPCTTSDVCAAGQCAGIPLVCPEGEHCVAGLCQSDPAPPVEEEPLPGPEPALGDLRGEPAEAPWAEPGAPDDHQAGNPDASSGPEPPIGVNPPKRGCGSGNAWRATWWAWALAGICLARLARRRSR